METTKTTWALDPSHSEITFKEKHMMISNVDGESKSFAASIEGEDFGKSTISATIDAESIFTNANDRDAHLKSADFFDVENYKQLAFEGTGLKKVDDDEYKLTGLLTIKGVTKEVTSDVEFGGINKDPLETKSRLFSVGKN